MLLSMIFGEYGILIIVEFILCASVIFFAGAKLARYGDQIGERTGLGQIWIGAIVLAMITSLPELVTNIGAVTIVQQPNLAIGNILGSNIFNLVIIALLDILQKKEPILTHVKKEHILTAGFGILLMGVVATALILIKVIGIYGEGLGYICSVTIIVIYVIAMILITRSGRGTPDIMEIGDSNSQKGIKSGKNDLSELSNIKVLSIFSFAAIIVILAGIWLVNIGSALSKPFYLFNLRIDLGATFVGSLFLAFATSLPEVSVSSAAVKIGAFDMAVGNVLGSNLFNILILPITDIFYNSNNIFVSVSSIHVLTAVIGIMLTSLAIIGLIYRSKKDFLYLGWDAISMLIIYVFGMYVLFQIRNFAG